jgi:septation ring formation regulator EzrA
MGAKLSLILGGLLVATAAGSFYYIDYLQDQIATLKANQIILETKVAEQNEAIENYLDNQQKIQTQLVSLEKEKQAAMRDVNKLRKTFSNLDLDQSALANPEDLQNRINRGSKRVLETLEKLTDPDQFDEKSSTNN